MMTKQTVLPITRKRPVLWFLLPLLCVLLLAGCQGRAGEPEKEKAEKKQEEKEVLVISSPEIETKETEEPDEKPSDREETPADSAQPDKSGQADGVSEEIANEPEKKGILIALDPGHQSPDVDMSASEPNAPGSDVMKMKATGGTSGRFTGIPEYQLNLDIALAVRDKLTAQGYDVIMTREDNDTAISNAERASLANEKGADISVRIHANGSEDSSSNGALTLIGSAQNPYVGQLYDDSTRLANSILDAYCSSTGMQNLGIQTNDTMTGINWSKIPVVILEMGFMTNEQDDNNMADESYREKMAEGITAGINAYYGY